MTAALGLILKSCLIRPVDQLMMVEVKPDISSSPLKALFILSKILESDHLSLITLSAFDGMMMDKQ